MKKRNFLITGALTGILCGLVLSLTACLEIPVNKDVERPEKKYSNSDCIYFYTDPCTGVQYIVYREKIGYAGLGGITPRLNPDGSLYVVEIGGVQNADIRTIS